MRSQQQSELEKANEKLRKACEAMLFSFDEIANQDGYNAALKRFCAAKHLARLALDAARRQG